MRLALERIARTYLRLYASVSDSTHPSVSPTVNVPIMPRGKYARSRTSKFTPRSDWNINIVIAV